MMEVPLPENTVLRGMTGLLLASLVFVVAGCAGPEPPTVGAVVDSCTRREAAEVAGLRPGDVVVAWRQGKDMGEVPSPFHLRIIEQERVLLGPVELTVRRDGDSMRITIPTGRWRVRLRPVFSPQDLGLAEEALEAEENGELGNAGNLWESLASRSTTGGRTLAAAFFHAQHGIALAKAGQKEASASILHLGAEIIPDERVRAAYWESAGARLLSAGLNSDAADALSSAVASLAPDSPGMAFVQLQLCRTNLRTCDAEAVRAVEIYRLTGGEKTIELAQTLTCTGTGAYYRGDLDAAEEGYRNALLIVRDIAAGSPMECELLGNLGLVAKRRGDFATAREFFRQDMAAAEHLGSGTLQYSHAANYLGLLAKNTGRYEVARPYYEKALASFRITNPNGPEVAGVLTNLGNVALREKDNEAARRFHEEALALRRRLDP
ncbi:MAG: tetratricopeptide repeat protein, partial [Acidobacteriota bacterium]